MLFRTYLSCSSGRKDWQVRLSNDWTSLAEKRALLFDSTSCILLTPKLLELKVSKKRLLPDSEALDSFAEPHPVVGALWISFYTIRHYDVPISSGQTAGPPDRGGWIWFHLSPLQRRLLLLLIPGHEGYS